MHKNLHIMNPKQKILNVQLRLAIIELWKVLTAVDRISDFQNLCRMETEKQNHK